MLGEPHSPHGYPYSGSPPPTPKLSVGVPEAGLLRARPGASGPSLGAAGFPVLGVRGSRRRGRRPSGDTETSKPAPLQRGGGNQGSRPGSPGFLLSAWKSHSTRPAAGATRSVLRPLFPAGRAAGGGAGGASAALRTGAGSPGGSPPPCVTAAHQKDEPIRRMRPSEAGGLPWLTCSESEGGIFYGVGGLVLGLPARRSLQSRASGLGELGGASLERSNRSPGKPGKKPDHPEGGGLSGLKCPDVAGQTARGMR